MIYKFPLCIGRADRPGMGLSSPWHHPEPSIGNFNAIWTPEAACLAKLLICRYLRQTFRIRFRPQNAAGIKDPVTIVIDLKGFVITVIRS
jgi:hypothetical protein